jgi:hypothetical protein
MIDPLARANRYKERAAECMRLAEITREHEIASHYRQIAEHYLTLAQGELLLAAAQGAVRKQSDA